MNTATNNTEKEKAAMWVSSSFLTDLIALDSPDKMAEHLSEQLCKMSKAETVIFFLHANRQEKCESYFIFPPLQTKQFEHLPLSTFCHMRLPDSVPLTLSEFSEDHPLKIPLAQAGVKNLMRIPVHSGRNLIGSLLLINLPDPNKSSETCAMMAVIGPTLGLAIQNCFAHQKIQEQKDSLEQLIKARTTELETANQELIDSRRAALNMMEDAVLAKEKLEMTQFSIDNASDSAFWIDKDGSFSYVNKAACQSLGYSQDELLKLSVVDIDPFYDIQGWKKHWDQIQKSRSTFSERFHKTKEGHIFPVEIHSNTITFQGKTTVFAFAHDISNRKAAEQELTLSRNRFSTLLSNLPGMAYLCENDKNWTMRFISDGATKITGYTAEDLINNKTISYKELIHPEDRNMVSNQIQASLNDHRHFEIEYRIITREGEERWLWERGIGRRNEKNSMLVEGFISDITHRKEVQNAMKESEARFRGIYDSMATGVAQVSLDFYIETANQAYCEMLGYTEKELKGKHLSEITAPEVLEKNLELQKQLVDGKIEHFRMEKTFIHKTGEPVYGLLDAVLIRKPDGSPSYCLGNVVNITDRKKAESELRRLSTAIEQSPETVMITNPKGIIEYVNPAFENQTGYTRSEAIGKNTDILRSGKHDDLFYTKMWDVLRAGNIWEGQLVNRRKDGQTYTEDATISPVRDEQNQITHYVAVKRDITQELIREEQMKQAQKMEVIGQLAGGIAHDFNNILQSILGFSELLMFSLDETETQPRSNVQEIQKATRHAADLTRQLLAFSRKQAVEFTSMNLSDTVKNTLSFVTSVIGENIQIETVFAPDPVPVNADPRQIERAILNMAINARDAMPDGGVLTLKTEPISFTKEDSEQSLQTRAGDFACLSISDTGTGMSPKTIKRIFEPFFSTKDPGKGTGLGLAAIYGIIQDHKGWINVYSEPGHGSTFKIYLPLKTGIPAQTTVTSQSGSDLNSESNNQRILIVEDDLAIRTLAKSALHKAGYQVESAPDAEEAEKIFDEQNGAFDLLFSDIVLPGKNGAELAAKLTEKKPNLQVILCSGYSGDRIRKAGIEPNSFCLLEKPFPIVKLLRMVHQVLAPVK
ncbi:PAS domain S-box protein [Tichowtungia aerotolerans]|uniref:histidine kinase n=1 Tax=Tichowtungia aerotolerans TaxID=2697043 RepID=A0A6P1M963_9BACT|nr:PAS domain S-box protein [Tichowtungia aerotolerans]QHI69603.1 PAS domain S-box protein [Tichowtungia aerotolerans]